MTARPQAETGWQVSASAAPSDRSWPLRGMWASGGHSCHLRVRGPWTYGLLPRFGHDSLRFPRSRVGWICRSPGIGDLRGMVRFRTGGRPQKPGRGGRCSQRPLAGHVRLSSAGPVARPKGEPGPNDPSGPRHSLARTGRWPPAARMFCGTRKVMLSLSRLRGRTGRAGVGRSVASGRWLWNGVEVPAGTPGSRESYEIRAICAVKVCLWC